MQQRYQAGFLDECSGNGLPFAQKALGGNPPLVMAKLSGAFKANEGAARLTYVTTSPSLACNVFCGSQLLFTRADFANAVEVLVDGWIHGFVANVVKGVYFSYVIPPDSNFNSSPFQSYELAPICVEAEVGSVSLSVENQVLPALPVRCTEGYNYALDYSANDPVSVTFGVSAGAGAGVQPCQQDSTFTSYIRSLNGKTANEQGEINISSPTVECISVDTAYENAGGKVAINSHCAPCCRCNDYKNTSDYSRSYAIEYAKAVKKLNELVAKYNSIVGGFNAKLACCTTADHFTPRFRFWPQQNFKLQIQAMAENNTDKRIRMSGLRLIVALYAAYDISAIDENGVTFSMTKDQPIAFIPTGDASYFYFKNLNPTSKGITFSLNSQGVVQADVDVASLPVASCGASGEHPNDIPPCTGYTMLTAGYTIVDPVFRKIVNLSGPVTITASLGFSYTGSKPGLDPCTTQSQNNIATGYTKPVSISPNKQAVNPCPAAKGSYLTIGSGGAIKIKFSDAMHGSGSLAVTYKQLTDAGWTTVSTSTAALTGTGQSEFGLGSIPSNLDPGTYKISATYVASTTGGLVTKCKASNASDDEVDIPATGFELGASFTV